MVKIGNIEVGEFPLLLAPMEDVSDPPFRVLCKELGADVVYTEFISAEGLIRYAEKSVMKLDIYDEERPVGIQIFGSEIESMQASARIVEQLQPEILDINYGCPVKKVACKGSGAGILLDIPKMEALTREVVNATHLPVTVKTRLGWDENTIRIKEVALRLQDAGIKALTIHGRTRSQMYKGEADWTLIGEVAAHPDIEIPIFGNGDVDSPEKALEMRNNYPVNGIMIGRAAIGYPWVFNEIKHFLKTGEHLPEPSLADRAAVCRRHLDMSVSWKGELIGIREMRRHYTNYFKGFPNFKNIRMTLVSSEDLEEIRDTLSLIQEDLAKDFDRGEIPAVNTAAEMAEINIRAGINVMERLKITNQ
ncbi:MAG: tRNA dihydrouridine synthase DusB [Bacteroidia bacterium]